MRGPGQGRGHARPRFFAGCGAAPGGCTSTSKVSEPAGHVREPQIWSSRRIAPQRLKERCTCGALGNAQKRRRCAQGSTTQGLTDLRVHGLVRQHAQGGTTASFNPPVPRTCNASNLMAATLNATCARHTWQGACWSLTCFTCAVDPHQSLCNGPSVLHGSSEAPD